MTTRGKLLSSDAPYFGILLYLLYLIPHLPVPMRPVNTSRRKLRLDVLYFILLVANMTIFDRQDRMFI